MDVRTRRPHLFTSLLLGLALSCALAACAAAQGGTPEQRAACEDDAMRLCGQYVPDVALITTCLKHNCRNLSARCRTVMQCGRRRGR